MKSGVCSGIFDAETMRRQAEHPSVTYKILIFYHYGQIGAIESEHFESANEHIKKKWHTDMLRIKLVMDR